MRPWLVFNAIFISLVCLFIICKIIEDGVQSGKMFATSDADYDVTTLNVMIPMAGVSFVTQCIVLFDYRKKSLLERRHHQDLAGHEVATAADDNNNSEQYVGNNRTAAYIAVMVYGQS